MARTIDLAPLPPSGGSAREEEAEMKAQGWTVENGKVSIPGRDIQNDSFQKSLASMLGRLGTEWLSSSSDAMASSYIAREHVEFQGRWNKYQIQMQQMINTAGQNGDYYPLGEQMMNSYNEFRESYKKERGKESYRIVAPLFDKHEKHVLSEIYLTETQTAKAKANQYLNTMRSDQLLKLRDNPSSLPLILRDMDPQIFQLGTLTTDEAQQEYAKTVDLFIKNALAMEGVTDPVSALQTLESVAQYMPATQYAKYKKQLTTAERQFARMQEKKITQAERAQSIIDLSQSDTIVSLTPEIKKNADILENLWGTEDFEPDDSIKKNDIYVKIGYVPPLYSTKLYNTMLHGSNEERQTASQSLIYLSNNLPPWSKDLPEDAIDLAYAYNEIGNIDLSATSDLLNRFNKYTSLTSTEREDMQKQTMQYIRTINADNRNSFEEARHQIFSTPGIIYGINPLPEEEFQGSLTAQEQTQFNREIVKRMNAYSALGFSFPLAEKQAILRAQSRWGVSYGIGGSPYPTYAPIENIAGADTSRKRKKLQEFITSALKEYSRPNNAPFPNEKDIRIVYNNGEGNDALYDILYRDEFYDQWLPYIVHKDGEDVALSISMAELNRKLYGIG